MLDGETDRDIVQASIGLAHDLGLLVVAEGVETVEQLEDLRSLGCDYAQGYLLSRPLTSDGLVVWVRDRRRGEAASRAAPVAPRPGTRAQPGPVAGPRRPGPCGPRR